MPTQKESPDKFISVALFYHHDNFHSLLKQNYKVVRFNDNKTSPPVYFNQMIGLVTADIYVFLSKNDNFTHPKTITKIVEKLWQYPKVKFCYTDNIFGGVRQFFPAYTNNISETRMLINTPLFIKKEVLQPFNTRLHYLYNYDMLRKLSRQHLGLHIPLALCESDNKDIDLQKEMDIINKND